MHEKARIEEDPVTGQLRIMYEDIEVAAYMYHDNAQRSLAALNRVIERIYERAQA